MRDGGKTHDLLAGDGAERGLIPFIEATAPLALLTQLPQQLQAILAAGVRHHGRLALSVGEQLSRRWLARCETPYRDDVFAVAERIGMPGGALLNLSYEWSCTTGVAADPSGVGNRMLRTLDWPMPEIGRHVAIARHDTPHGAYVNVTWPGFVGVLTAMAPGRFSAAINQPPMRRHSPVFGIDWLVNRRRVWRSSAQPPSHLLRRVFETCATYADARAMLRDEPLCIPAFFTLSGVGAGEGCVVERLEDRAVVHDGETCMANHFLGFSVPSRLRGDASEPRRAQMQSRQRSAGDDFGWVVPPILNKTTRLSVIANAARGALKVQGWEGASPVTQVFDLPVTTRAA